jgi:hypothetical protein
VALATLVISPLPADLTRDPQWGESAIRYDTGARQASTPYVKPLYRFTINFTNIPRSKQSSLEAFYNDRRGKVEPFLMQDPYDFASHGGIVVNTGTSPTSFWAVTARGYPVIAKSGHLRLVSALSGTLTQGSHYNIDQSTGLIVASLRPSSADFWTATSLEFYKKVAFASYSEQSRFWNVFGGSFVIEEIALS